MLDAADVLVDAALAPVGEALVDHGLIVVRAGIAQEVPRGLDESVHRVGFALRLAAALRAAALVELGHLGQRRAGAGDLDVFRQHDRQLLIGHRHIATVRAVDDRHRAAPVALARDAPVAQAELHLLLAEILGGEVGGDGIDGGFIRQAVVLAGIDTLAVDLVGVGLLPAVEREGLAFNSDDLLDSEVVFLGKGEVALVVRRNGHHGAFAVAHQHVVADPDFDFFTGQRVLDEDAGRHALLFHRRDVGFGDTALLAFLDEDSQFGIVLCSTRGQRVFGGDGAEGDAHDGVGTSGEYPQLVGLAVQFVREGKAYAGALADPVLLHQAHLLRPARQLVEIGEQFLGVGGDLHVVHGDLALLDQRARAPAAAVDDLLVGEHGVVDRVPVHGAELLVDQAFFVEAGEQPLLPAVVLGGAGGELALPVDGKAQRLELGLHVVDVGVGPLRRRHVVLHRRVFGRHAEGVPAHRLQHVVAEHGVEAREHVADRVIAHMAHVQLARGVGEHRQAVVLGARRVFDGAGSGGLDPVILGGAFNVGGAVFVLHGAACFAMSESRKLYADSGG